ncbi:MAG: hypothetical protein P4L55_04645 [Syntrophobacteraceae bacterium]|nr:hypothetical protein [Syntrophobacteraceae bacterium]
MNSEQVVNDFLSGYGLRLEVFDKNQLGIGKTPDFKVYSDEKLIFYCEVKNAQKDMWLDKELEKAAPGDIVGGLRNDPVFSRLSTHIHKACKQFESVNKDENLPNVLAFHNEDENSGFLDLLAVTTGNFFAEGGAVFPVYKQFSEGRIKADIEKIHLFIWINAYKPHRFSTFLFNTINTRYQDKLCPIFGFDPEKLAMVHSSSFSPRCENQSVG